MRVGVTGASGKLGRATTLDLVAHGYEVVATDLVPPGRRWAYPCCELI